MARLPVQLSFHLTISIMMLSSLSSIFLSLSDAARAGTFSKDVETTPKKSPGHISRMRWLTEGVSAESLDGKMPVLRGLDVSSSSAVWSLSKNEVDQQSADEMRTLRGRELGSSFDAEESRRGPLPDIVDISHVEGKIVQLLRDRGIQSAAWLAEVEDEDESLQLLLQMVAPMCSANIPALGMCLNTDDEECSFRITAVVFAAVLGASIDIEETFRCLVEVNFPKRKALQADISTPGMWHGSDEQSEVRSRKRALLADISPPGIWTDAEVNESRFHKRRLLADISPPGMWSDDDDDMQDKYHKRRLLADISPPGMWQGSDELSADTRRK